MNAETAPLADFTFHLDRAAHRLDHSLGNRQSHAFRIFMLARCRVAAERLEQVLQFGGWNTGPLVEDAQTGLSIGVGK